MKEKNLKITLLDDMREVIGVGLILNGKSINSTDPEELKQAAQTIIDMKPYVAAFTYESRPMVEVGRRGGGATSSSVRCSTCSRSRRSSAT